MGDKRQLNEAFAMYVLARLHVMTPGERLGYNLEMGEGLSMLLQNGTEGGKRNRKSKRNRKNKRKTRKFKGGLPDYPLGIEDDPLSATNQAIVQLDTYEPEGTNDKDFIARLATMAEGYNAEGINPAYPNISRQQFITKVQRYYLFKKRQYDNTFRMWGFISMSLVTTAAACYKVYNKYQGEMLMADMTDQSTTVGMFFMLIDFISGIAASRLNREDLRTQLMKGRREARSQILYALATNELVDVALIGISGIGTRFFSGQIGDINASLLALQQQINAGATTATAAIAATAQQIQQTEARLDAARVNAAVLTGGAACTLGAMAAAGAAAGLGMAGEVGMGAANLGMGAARLVGNAVGEAGRVIQRVDQHFLHGAEEAQQAAAFRQIEAFQGQMAMGQPLPLGVRNQVNNIAGQLAPPADGAANRALAAPDPAGRIANQAIINAPHTVPQILNMDFDSYLSHADAQILGAAIIARPENFLVHINKIVSFKPLGGVQHPEIFELALGILLARGAQ